MVGIGDLLGAASPLAQQLEWQVGQPIAQALLAPMLSELTQKINARNPVEPLSPADLADLVVRSFLDAGEAAGVAARSGVNAADFALMVKLAADAPDTTMLVEAYRRKIIPRDAGAADGVGLVQGIAQGRLDPKWTGMIEALGDVPIGVADAVDGVVEGQISFEQGAQFAYQNGVSAQNFQHLVDIRGNPPTPTQLMEMVRRGVIGLHGRGPDVLSFEQGISEGATKNKWTAAFEQIMTTVPPARTVVAMLHNGSITSAQALTWFRQEGLSEEAAAAYLKDASHTKTAAARTLVKGDVLKLYADKLVPRAEALAMLGNLGYDEHDAQFELAIQDFHAEVQLRALAVSKVRTMYLGRKISKHEAVNAMNELGMPPDERDAQLKLWDLERGLNLKILTVAEITSAYEYGIMDAGTAIRELVAYGYTDYDAWVILSVKAKGPITLPPAGGPSPADRVEEG